MPTCAKPRRRPSWSAVKAELDALADSHRYGRAVSEGVRTVLVGRTNTGKSSLLNLLLGFERALVSDEAGTTRDVVSAPAVVCGIPLLLADTARLRAGAGEVERRASARASSSLCRPSWCWRCSTFRSR